MVIKKRILITFLYTKIFNVDKFQFRKCIIFLHMYADDTSYHSFSGRDFDSKQYNILPVMNVKQRVLIRISYRKN